MTYMKHLLSFLVAVLVAGGVMSQNEDFNAYTKLPKHPRLLMLKGEEGALKKSIRRDSYWTALHNDFLKEADKVLTIPVHQKQMEGKRMERYEAMRRTFLLGYAYRMTKQREYAVRAEKELLCVAAYDTWNPSHFLDVAQGAIAFAMAYDWLFDSLSEERKSRILDFRFSAGGIEECHSQGHYRKGTEGFAQREGCLVLAIEKQLESGVQCRYVVRCIGCV